METTRTDLELFWKPLKIGQRHVLDIERGVWLYRGSKRSWGVYFAGPGVTRDPWGKVELNHAQDHSRPMLQVYKHKAKDQVGGCFLIQGEKIEGYEGKSKHNSLRAGVEEAMRMLVLIDVVPRLRGE